ncbi:MAG: dihydropyrimidinase [Clostridiales bacterium]
MYDLLIKNGALALPTETRLRDIAIRGEKIAAIGQLSDQEAMQTIDAYGKLILPGAIDAHTHMDLDLGFAHAVDDFTTGSRAALAGGVTTIIDHIAFGNEKSNLKNRLNHYRMLAEGKSYIDYSFHGVLQHGDQQLNQQIAALCREGVPSFKAYMTYAQRLDDQELQQALEAAKEHRGLVAVHAEDHLMIQGLREGFGEAGLTAPSYHALSRPNISEAQAVQKALSLAAAAGDAPIYLVHISTSESVELIRSAREKGQKNIYAETCPQYLLLDRSRYLDDNQEGLKYIMSPPLRSPEDNRALWQALTDGVLQVVATDHCPFDFRGAKQLGKDDFRACPGGIGGVEERLRLLYTYGVQQRFLSVEQFTAVCCANPAKIFGLYPRKGALLIGSDADITILDPTIAEHLSVKTSHSAVDYNAYEGQWIGCVIDTVLLRGDIAYRQGQFLAEPGWGQQLQRHIDPIIRSSVF